MKYQVQLNSIFIKLYGPSFHWEFTVLLLLFLKTWYTNRIENYTYNLLICVGGETEDQGDETFFHCDLQTTAR